MEPIYFYFRLSGYMHKDVKNVIRDIKSLKIQGARNIAKEALDVLSLSVKESKAKTPQLLRREIATNAEALASSRPTEPMMRNILEEAVRFAEKNEEKDLRKAFVRHSNDVLKGIDEGAKKLAEYGARIIPDNALVLTICHSSTSTMCMIAAKKMKKKFSVVSFETRPRYQGRKTATELAEAGIDVTSAVDGAMNHFMKKADIVIVGADSV